MREHLMEVDKGQQRFSFTGLGKPTSPRSRNQTLLDAPTNISAAGTNPKQSYDAPSNTKQKNLGRSESPARAPEQACNNTPWVRPAVPFRAEI
jgi:hypothetical protein